MFPASCPRCRESVTVPAGVAESALVRCPHCQSEYAISEALAQLPPRLIVVSAASQQIHPAAVAPTGWSAAVTENGNGPHREDQANVDFLDDLAATPSAETSHDSHSPAAGLAEASDLAEGFVVHEGPSDAHAVTATAVDEATLQWMSPESASATEELDFVDELASEAPAVDQQGPLDEFATSAEGDQPFSFDEAPAPTMAAPMSALKTSPPKAKKKKGNPLLAGAMAILGGMMALPLSMLVLWWLPGGWAQDTLGVGPTVAQYVPFLVPAEFSGSTTNDAKHAANSQVPTAQTSGTAGGAPKANTPPNTNQSNKIPSEEELKNKFAQSGTGKGEKPSASEKTEDPASLPTDPPLVTDPGEFAVKDNVPPKIVKPENPIVDNTPPTTPPEEMPEKNPPAEKPVKPAVAVDPLEKPEIPPKPANVSPSDGLGTVKGAPQIAAEALDKSLQQTDAALKGWDALPADAPIDDKKKALGAFRAAFADLGQTSTFAPGSAAAVDEILLRVGKNDDKFDLASRSAGRIIASTEKATGGLLLAGIVRDVHAVGKLQEIRISLPKSKTEEVEIVIVTDHDPGPGAAGQKVVALGSIVEEPAKNLTGYEGQEAQIVWSKHVLVVGK